MAAREGGAPVANPRRDVNADETPELAHRSAAPLSVVGVGASSGGIEPLVALLRCLPVDVDFAVVVITGLNPARASDLAGVLSRATVLPVSIAVDGQRVRPGRVYVMPPDAHLVVEGDVLRFAPGSAESAPAAGSLMQRILGLFRRADGAGLDVWTRDGAGLPFEAALSVVDTEHGPHVVAFINDVNERRESEARIRDYQAQLQRAAFDTLLAEERERRRIAAELHDGVGQTLALVQVRLTSLREALPADARAELDECVRMVAQAVGEARTLTFDLSPPILYDLGLDAAVAWLADQFAARHALTVTLEGEGVGALDEDVAAVLFRAVRELLTNVVKHARCARAKVTLRREGGHAVIVVEDDGVGIRDASDAPPRGGFGLFSVRERVSRLQGSVELGSADGAGTRVTLRVPVGARGGSEQGGP